MSHYAVGTRFEHKVRDDLTGNGYDVLRAAGSKGSSKVDLVAFKPGQLLLVQCKRGGALPAAEWDRIVEVAGWVDGYAILAANGPAGRGVTYVRLLGPKRPRLQLANQPCSTFRLDYVRAPLEAPGSPLRPEPAVDAELGVEGSQTLSEGAGL